MVSSSYLTGYYKIFNTLKPIVKHFLFHEALDCFLIAASQDGESRTLSFPFFLLPPLSHSNIFQLYQHSYIVKHYQQ